jgi:hypothetical protein
LKKPSGGTSSRESSMFFRAKIRTSWNSPLRRKPVLAVAQASACRIADLNRQPSEKLELRHSSATAQTEVRIYSRSKFALLTNRFRPRRCISRISRVVTTESIALSLGRCLSSAPGTLTGRRCQALQPRRFT